MNDRQQRLQVGDSEIALTVDAPLGSKRGRVVLIPPFGMNAERLFPAAYLLAMNGFEVYRIDPRDHPGESSGNTDTFRLSRLTEDIVATLDAAQGDMLVSISLSARCALRALRQRRDFRAAVLVTPVVNVRYTLHQVLEDDWFERIYREPVSHMRVLGYQVETAFFADCRIHRLFDLTDTCEDVADCEAQLTFIAGSEDPWVAIDEVQQVAQEALHHNRSVKLMSIQAASHQLYRNPVLAMQYLQIATQECLRISGYDPEQAIFPPFSEIIAVLEETKRVARLETHH